MPTYFNEKSQTWYCKFYYRDYRGRSCQKKKGGFRLQRDAQEWERSFIRKYEGSPDMTFSDLYEIYAEDMRHRLRHSTMITKDHLIRTKILPYFGELPIRQIEAPIIRRWQNEMGAFRMKNRKGYSQTYLRVMNNQLSAILNYAVRYYRLPSNPCHKAGAMGKKVASRKTFWNFTEFLTFLSYFEEGTQAHLIFSMLYYTGIRIGDADGKISLNQQKPSKHAGLRRFGPEKFLQRNNEFMKERPIFYKKPIKTEKDFSTWLRCFYYTTKAVITEYIYF